MTASQPYVILPFSAENLNQSLSSARCTPEEAARHHRAVFLAGYLRTIGVKTIIVEHEYTDGDYLEDFASYYVRCFESYERRCKRLHFFSTDVSNEEFDGLIVGKADGKSVKAFQDAYCGFVVARPLPSAIVGRTILKTYPVEGGRRNYTVVREYKANLFGLELKVTSLPFQEQDSVLAACATVALWSAFQKTAELFGSLAPRPAAITRTANGVVRSFRAIPSHGLTLEQMAHAVRDVGLEPEVVPASPSTPIVSLAYAHLSMGLPVILAVDIEGRGLHAITLTGYSLLPNRVHGKEVAGGEQSIPMIGLRINEFYGHDDQIGPFSKVEIRPSAAKYPVLFQGAWIDTASGKQLELRPKALLIPIYNKVRVTFLDIQKWLTRVTAVFGFVLSKADALEWDVRLVTVNDFKTAIKTYKVISEKDRQNLLFSQQPRFLWCATLRFSGHMIMEILADATDMERSFPIREVIWYEDKLKEAMNRVLSSPPLDDILLQMLEKRFRDLLLKSVA